MATLKYYINGDWKLVEAYDPTALHKAEPIELTNGSVEYTQEVKGNGTLVINRAGTDDTVEGYCNNVSIGDGDIIPCVSAGLFGSKGYAYAVARAGGEVYKSIDDGETKEAVTDFTTIDYSTPTGEASDVNLMAFPEYDQTHDLAGVPVSVYSDGKGRITLTATGFYDNAGTIDAINADGSLGGKVTLPAGTYTVSKNIYSQLGFGIVVRSSTQQLAYTIDTYATFTLTEETEVWLAVSLGIGDAGTYSLEVMVNAGSSPLSFTEYSDTPVSDSTGDGISYYVTTGQTQGFNAFSFANGSVIGNYGIAGGRGCFITSGKDTDPNDSKFGMSLGYENVANKPDDVLIGTRNYAFNYRGAYAQGYCNLFDGEDNTHSNGWLFGYNNTAKADSLVGIGIYNQNLNENTFTFGRRLTTNKEKQMLLGWNANAKDGGSYNTLFAIGDGTETAKSNALLIYKSASTQQASHAYLYCGLGIGDASTVTVDKHALAVGNATAIHSNSIAVGNGVKTAANNQAVFGAYSNNVASGLMVVGDGSSSSAHNIFELRNNHTAYFNDCSVGICDGTSSVSGYTNSLMVGTYSRASRNNQLKIGEYSTAGTDILFAIGNGKSQSNRSDAFRVTETYSLSNLPMYVGGTADDNRILTKNELEEYVTESITDSKVPTLLNSVSLSGFDSNESETLNDLFIADCAYGKGLCFIIIEYSGRKFSSPIFYHDCHSTDYSFSFVNTVDDTLVNMRVHCENTHDFLLDVHRGGSIGLNNFTISLYKLYDL